MEAIIKFIEKRVKIIIISLIPIMMYLAGYQLWLALKVNIAYMVTFGITCSLSLFYVIFVYRNWHKL